MRGTSTFFVSKAEIYPVENRVRVNVSVDGERQLWFEVRDQYAEFLTERMDYLAVALLPLAMIQGRDLQLDGPVTDTLLHQLNTQAQPLIRVIYPAWSEVGITASQSLTSTPKAHGVATGFSGGVDSLSALQTHFLDEKVPESTRITHLLSNNVGSFRKSGGRERWAKVNARIEPLAAELGLPLIVVDSNLEDFYPAQIDFKHIHTFCNAAIPHLLSKGIGTMFYASAYDYRQVLSGYRGSGKNVAHLDPILLPLLSSQAVALHSADPEKTRVMKTLALVNSPYRSYLDVCTSSNPTQEKNCSRCYKCMRTEITLEIADILHEFMPDTFEKKVYLRHRSRHMAKILSDKDDLSLEIVELARARNFRWPLAAKIGSIFVPLYFNVLKRTKG